MHRSEQIRPARAWGFDVSAACSGFLYALTVGAQFIASGAHDKVVVVGADVMSSITNPDDRSTCVLFGDAAGAVLLEPSEDENLGMLDYLHEVDGSGGEFSAHARGRKPASCVARDRDKKMHYVHQDGQPVFKYAVRKMGEISRGMSSAERV